MFGHIRRHQKWLMVVFSALVIVSFVIFIDPTTGRPYQINFLRPYQGFGNIQYNEYGSSSSYHSMQMTLQRRFSHGLMFGAADLDARHSRFSRSPVHVDGAGGRPMH